MLAADPVHDLQRALAGAAAGGARHERDELLRLVRAGADVERLEREARVADPGEAVVPVALAADGLGQRRGRRGDDRAGRAVGEALQDARAVAHELAVRAVVDVVLGLPGAPRLDGVVDPRADLGRPAVASGAMRSSAEAQRSAKPCASPARTRNAARIVASCDLQRHGRAHRDAAGAERARAAVLEPDQRPDQPVLGARRELHDQLDVALDALDRAQQLVRRVEAEVVAALALGGRHRVDQPHRPGVRRERRLDRERAGEVAALGVERAGRPDRPVAGVGVEQPREDRAGCRSAACTASRSSPRDPPARSRCSRPAGRSRRSASTRPPSGGWGAASRCSCRCCPASAASVTRSPPRCRVRSRRADAAGHAAAGDAQHGQRGAHGHPRRVAWRIASCAGG